MAAQTICPRCGARDSFMKGYLPDTCICRLCQSQLGWQEIPGCGPDCTALEPEPAEPRPPAEPAPDPGAPVEPESAEPPAAPDPGAPDEGSAPDGGSADA
jgi:hypothetical protein